MLKRILWLALAAAAGWLAWQWLRERQADTTYSPPLFAPPRPLERYTPPASIAPPAPPPTARPGPATALESVAAPPAPTDSADAALDTPQTPPEPAKTAAERVPGAAEGSAPEEETSEAGSSAPETGEPATNQQPEHSGITAQPPVAAMTASGNERATIADSLAGAEAAGEPLLEGVTGYCVRCKTKRVIQHAHEETTESGRRAARGTCPVCGANMFTFLKDDE
jgi:hypothetical protein